MGPSGRGAPALSCASELSTSRGSVGRSRPPRFLPGGPAGWVSASPAGMGSSSRRAAGVCARFRSDAKAGGVTRASSTRARTYVESPGPSATRPPSTPPAAPSPGAFVPPPQSAGAASRSASTAFICAG
eukprot:4682622-Pleurochrysis_carterae.AAC.1